MRYLSVCSGIEAATVAWHPLGWEPAAFSEIEKFPRAVLQHHYPNVPLHGDFTTIKGDEYGPIDLLVGGTPCQDFSVAGLRAGITGERGNLTLEFLRLAARVAPRWIVWENVPGVLSSDGGRALGAFLGGLAELGYGFAYRVLDAQYFNVAQRRARVFVVGYLGDWRRAAAVLFESESLRGHPAPRREARKGIAPTLSARTKGGGGLGTDFDLDGGLVRWPAEVAPTLNAHFGDKMGLEDQHALNGAGLFVAHALRAEGFDASEDGTGRGTPLVPVQAFNWQSGGDGRGLDPQDAVSALSCHQTPAIAFALRGRDDGAVPEIHDQGDTASALRAANGGSTRDMVAVAIPILEPGKRTGVSTTDKRAGLGVAADGDPMFTLQSGAQHAVALSDVAQPLRTNHRNNSDPVTEASMHVMHNAMQVRRLTPRECERLQGFPDDYTLIPYRGKQAADGPRYKALGNSMAVPVMHWIGKRIAEVEEATR